MAQRPRVLTWVSELNPFTKTFRPLAFAFGACLALAFGAESACLAFAFSSRTRARSSASEETGPSACSVAACLAFCLAFFLGFSLGFSLAGGGTSEDESSPPAAAPACLTLADHSFTVSASTGPSAPCRKKNRSSGVVSLPPAATSGLAAAGAYVSLTWFPLTCRTRTVPGGGPSSRPAGTAARGVGLATFRVACAAEACRRCAGSRLRSWMNVHWAPWVQVPLAKNAQWTVLYLGSLEAALQAPAGGSRGARWAACVWRGVGGVRVRLWPQSSGPGSWCGSSSAPGPGPC